MGKLKKYLKRDDVKAFPAFNIGGEVYAEDNPDTPTITDPSQKGYGIIHLGGELDWESEEDFKDKYVPYETTADRLMYLRDLLNRELEHLTKEMQTSHNEVDLMIMRIELNTLVTCRGVICERISRLSRKD